MLVSQLFIFHLPADKSRLSIINYKVSYPLSIPFFAFRLHFISGGSYLIPLQDHSSIRIEKNLAKVAKEYAEEFQKHVLNEGKYEQLLEEWILGDQYKNKLKVKFQAAKDGFSYPAFELEFEYFFKPSDKGIWGIVPSLKVEGFGESIQDLEDILVETIKDKFKKQKRTAAVQGIVSAIWWESIELLKDDLKVKIHSLTELENQEEIKKDLWLPKVAERLGIKEKVSYGREEELEHFVRILKGNFNRNILLVGAAGVGKTALVWEYIFQQDKYKISGNIWETNAAILIKELSQNTGWQDNLTSLCKELSLSGDFLFIRNLLELFEVGKYIGNEVSIAEYLLTFISRGEVNIITECTEDERAIIELKSSNFLSHFQKINLYEPKEKLEKIILQKVNDRAGQLEVKIETEAIKETIRLNKRFTPYSGFPGKPIRFLEGILLNFKSNNTPTGILTRSDVIRTFCEETGMPLMMVDPDITMNPKKIKSNFNREVFGQEKAISSVVNMLSAVKTGLSKSGKPIASFLFVGPTGVGKTELAKVLSRFMFGSREKMVRFDMSEYSGGDAVSKLLGSGYYSDGLLTSTVRREPFCVLLFDEIEKAHPVFFDLLLQILSEGRLTDSKGKLVNFCSTIIIMTSNIGATRAQQRGVELGKSGKNKNKDLAQKFLTAVKENFKPELYNRIDEVIPFDPLSKEIMHDVVKREMEEIKKREGIKFRKMDLTLADEVLDHLAKKGYDSKYGARQLQRTIREQLIIPLSKELNLYPSDDQLVVDISIEKKQIKIEVDSDPLGFDLMLEEMEKSTSADLAGEYRRGVQRFKEGYFFNQFQSDLDILEREKKELGEKFWQKKKRGNTYTRLLTLNSRINQLLENINQLEFDLSLAAMGLKTYRPEWGDDMEVWKKDLFQFQIDLYLEQNQDANNCSLRIYGPEVHKMLDFYLGICKNKTFTFTAQTLWYREKYYNEEILIQEDLGDEWWTPRKQYFKRLYERGSKTNFLPEKPNDIFVGIDLHIEGNCPFLFFKNESGAQRWKMSKEDDTICIVEVMNSLKTPYPENMHRKEPFHQKMVYRTFEPGKLIDKRAKINREVQKGEAIIIIQEILDAQFEMNLELAVG